MNDTHKEKWERAKARAKAIMALLGHGAQRPLFAEGPSRDPSQDAVDALVDTLTARHDALGPVFSQVSEIVKNASSYEDMLETLYERYSQMNTKDFETILKQAGFAADLWGYVKARERA